MAELREHDITVTLQELREEFGMSEDEMTHFIAAQVTAGNSALRSHGFSLANTASAVDSRGKVTKIPAVFSGKITGDKQLDIKKRYPDFEITFTQERAQSHAVAACCRMLDRLVLKKRAPAGQGMVSVGGNYEHEIMSGGPPVHCCAPSHELVADAKEAAREVQRMARLRGVAASPHKYDTITIERVRGFLEKPERWRCKRLAQNCIHQAGVMLVAHVYDMSLEQIVDAMISHNSGLVLGCMLLHNDMLIQDSGKLASVDGYYSIERGRIKYGFDGEMQWEYSHDWKELQRFAFGGAVVQSSGRQAFYSITERRGDTIFFSMALMPVTVPLVPVTLNWRSGAKKRAVVKGYKLSDVDRTSFRKAMVPATFSYPYDSFVKTLSYAIERMEKGSFSLEDLQRKTRAIFADTTINSVRVSGFERLEDDQMAYYLANIGVLASLAVNCSSAEETVLLDGVRMVRSGYSDGLLRKTAGALKAWVKQPFKNTSTVHKLWRSFAEGLLSSGSEFIAGISWEIDFGYRTAVSKLPECYSGVQIPMAYVDTEPPIPVDVLATLMAAASESEEMALVLAETAATINTHPVLEEWATSLRKKFDISVDDFARKAELSERQRCDDPDVESTEIHERASANLFTDDTTLAEPVSAPEETPRERACALGVSLQSQDEVSSHAVAIADVEAVANAAIAEAIFLIQAAEDKTLGECLVNFRQTTVDGLPDINKLSVHGKLNYAPDYWTIDADGYLASSSFRGKTVSKTEKWFPSAAVYLPREHAIVRVATQAIRGTGEYRHRVLFGESGTGYTGRLCMTTDNLNIYNGPVILSNMRAALKKRISDNFQMAFIEGVPGCGKTHYIINAAKSDAVVIACGRENADTTRVRVSELAEERRRMGLGVTVLKDPQKRVRTLDSALMRPAKNSASFPVGTMFLDECFQDHAGKFWACVKLWGPTSVQALGDRRQIPYVDRCYTDKCHLPRLSHWSIRVGKYISFRCPMDAAMAVASFYGYKNRTNSKIVRSLSLQLNTPVVPMIAGWKYLTMYQDDKQALLRKGFADVNTIGEVQGQTYERVALVRIQEREQALFLDENQVDVALTRHTKEFIYYAPDSRKDLVERLVEETYENVAMVSKFGEISTAGKSVFDV